jgi:hypothetical protein
MWAVNGVVSVATSVGAVAVAIVGDFSWAIAMGAILYLAAAGLVRLGSQEVAGIAGLGIQA